MASILVLHGPNLNMLGSREPHLYGSDTLDMINTTLAEQAHALNHQLTSFQSNTEGLLIDRVQACLKDKTDFIIINPAAFTHTSLALREALTAVEKPFIEVHLSNIYGRETFRHHSYFSAVAVGVIAGLGPQGYCLALQAAHHYLNSHLR